MLSLLFSDLAGSAELSSILDAEDLREIYQQTREVAYAAVEKYGGRVKDFMGDGILAYFGYPMALERGAQAAVNAGLEMVREVALRRWPMVERAGQILQMRVGIHTGEVVVGDMGKIGGAHEPDAVVGAAPIIASRLQAVGALNAVTISRSTYELIAGQFQCRELPAVTLKGVPEPMSLFEVLSPEGVRTQVERMVTRCTRPLVGRSMELERLQAAWQTASRSGHSGVCVKGEAGIGKSRLMAELKATLRAGEKSGVWEFQCSPYHANTSWFAVADALRHQVCDFSDDDTDADRITKLETALHRAGLADPVHFWLLADLLGLPYAQSELDAALAPEARKRPLMELLASLFPALSGGQPALYEFNDAHWIDATTAEWLPLLRRHLNGGGLIAFTTRPDAPTLEPFLEGLEVIALSGLADAEVESLARSVAGGRILPREVVAHIARTCSGVPLFVEEMTTAQLLSGELEEQENHYSLKQWSPERHLPFSLRDLLQSRLDQFGVGDREVAQVCAVIGSDVTPRFVAAVLGEKAPERTEASLGRLADAGFFTRDADGESYSIRHALIQNAAYESMLKAARSRFHRRIAELLQTDALDGFRAPPELIAEHFTQAGLLDVAAAHWLQSAQSASRRSAVAEAVALARRGLAVLSEIGYPPSLREVQVSLVTTLGTALVASKGFASLEAATAFREAESLLAGVDDPQKLFPALWGLCITHLMRGQLNPALDYATRMLEIGRGDASGAFLIEALWTRGATLFWLGRLDEAEAHLTEAVAIYRPEHHANAHLFGQDPGVAARVYLMQLRAFRLQAGEASACARECLELARRLRHPHSLAWAMAGGAMVRLLLGDVDGTLENGPRTIEYCMQQEHPFWLSAMKMMTGWALTQKGQVADGLKMVREGFALYEMLGTNLISPVFCALLADCCSTAGDPVEAASWAARARDMVERNNERLSLPVVLLTDGQLMLRAGGAEALRAESCFREALECARGQGALLREIQAAALLAQCLLGQGRAPEAITALTPYAAVITSPDAPEFLRPLAALFGAPVLAGAEE